MATSRRSQPCSWSCPLKGTGMCVQNQLCCQAMAEKRLTLGVLQGLKHIYRQHVMPPCIASGSVRWSEMDEVVDVEGGELAMA